jgi:CBS domain-containing protein
VKASDFMTKNVTTCNIGQTVEDAATLMAKKGFSVVPIVNDADELVGLITESDFISKIQSVPHALVSLRQLFGQSFHASDVEQIYKESKAKKLGDVMTKNPKTVSPDTSLDEVVTFMSDKNLKRLPVVDQGKVVGIITRTDVIRAFNMVK